MSIFSFIFYRGENSVLPALAKMPSLKKQLFLIVLILFCAPVLVMLYDIYYASKTDDILIVNLEQKLTGIVTGIHESITGQLESLPPAEKDAALEEAFNRAAAPAAQAYPGVRLGLYLPAKDTIITHGFLHEFTKRLPEEKSEREKRILRETREGITAVQKSGGTITRLGKTWDDQFLEYMVPVRTESGTVAVLWAQEMIHPSFARSTKMRLFIRYVILALFTLGVIASLLTIASLVSQVQMIKNGLLEMGRDIRRRLPEMPGEMGQITGAVNAMAAGLLEKEQKLEQLRREENLIALGRLVTTIAHELRGPVSIIQALVQVLAGRLGHLPELREFTTRIEQQIEKHNRLVSELLDFGRPNPGASEQMELTGLAAAVLQECSSLLEQKRISLSFTPSRRPLPVKGNQDKIKQVFLNIILNAVQAMSAGGRLALETFRDGEKACVTVRDTGPGIPKDELAQIFTPFYTRKSGGGGLGLAISQRIVQIHGGTIGVESEPGTGTAFTLCFPLAETKSGD
jgi:signal transduction histidine kinase